MERPGKREIRGTSIALHRFGEEGSPLLKHVVPSNGIVNVPMPSQARLDTMDFRMLRDRIPLLSVRSLVLLALPSLASCVHAGETRTTLIAQPELQTLLDGTTGAGPTGSAVHYLVEGIVVEDVLEAPVQDAWEALSHALVVNSLPPDIVDPNEYRMGVAQAELQGSLGGQPLRLFLDCGTTESRTPMADNARVYLTMVTVLRPEGESATRILTELAATAVPLGVGREGGRTCTTRGVLERQIQGAVRDVAVPEATTPQGPTQLSPGPRPAGPPGIRVADPRDVTAYTAALELGEEVRVTVGDFEPMIGTVQYVGRDEMTLLWWGRSVPVDLQSIRVLEIRRHRQSYGWWGAALGGGAGFVMGTFSDLRIQGSKEKQGKILSPFIGTVFGGLLGAYVGSKMRGDYWEAVQPAEVFPSISSDRFGVGIRVPVPNRGRR